MVDSVGLRGNRSGSKRSSHLFESLEKRVLFAVDITLDGASRFQTIEGFGSAIADYAPGTTKYNTDAWQNMYYQDLGNSILRVSMFNTVADGPDNNHKTHDFDFTGNYATDLANMDFTRVATQKNVAVAGNAKKLDQLKVIMSMWTPPGWMKGPEVNPYTGATLSPAVNPVYNGNDSSGGSIIDTPANWQQFGRYVATYVKGWQDYTGMQVYGISLQNELANHTSYSSCVYSYALYAKAAQAVHDAFVTYGLTTKLMGPEHFSIGSAAEPWQSVQMQNWINAVQPTTTDNGILQIFATHNYGNGTTPDGRSAQQWSDLWNGHTGSYSIPGLKNYNKEVWQTEQGGQAASWAGAMLMAGKEQDALAYGNVSAWLEWQTTEGDTLGTYNLTAGTDGLLKGDKYYTYKQFSKYIRPGSVRINATPNSMTGVEVSAYVNDTNHTATAVLLNQTATAQTINIHLSNLSMSSFNTYVESMAGSWGLAKPTVTFSGGIATITMPASSIVTLQGSTFIPAVVNGNVYVDNDDNGAKGTGDTNFSNVRIYDDVNRNGVWDSGAEPSVFSDTSGNYSLGNLDASTHRIKVAVPAGYRATQPTSGQYDVTLTSGQVFAASAFGLTAKAKFSGTISVDNDNSGTFTAGDGYYGTKQVYLDTNLDGAYQVGEPTRTTDVWGLYSFNNLAAGTYRVRVVTTGGYVVTTPSTGYRDVVVTAGASLSSQSLAVRIPGTSQISGVLYKDNDNSGTLNTGDVRLTSAVVWLDLDNDGVQDAGEPTTTTDATYGQYYFNNLAAGTYRVRVAPVSGWHVATPVLGYYDVLLAADTAAGGKYFGFQLG